MTASTPTPNQLPTVLGVGSLTPEAIEAAARALCLLTYGVEWEHVSEAGRKPLREEARAALTAAYPLIADHQARAVLAAISEAGAVEWGVFRKDSATEKLSEYVWASAEDATHWAAGEFTPDFAAITEARSRITGPWTAVEG